jgi:nitroreductase
MSQGRDRSSALEPIRRVSQIRQYSPEPVPDAVVDQLLELARWTGSAKNGQPWRFIVVRDKDRLKKIAAMRRPSTSSPARRSGSQSFWQARNQCSGRTTRVASPSAC